MFSRFVRNHSRPGAFALLLLLTCLGATEAFAARNRDWVDGNGMADAVSFFESHAGGGGGAPVAGDPLGGEQRDDGVDDGGSKPPTLDTSDDVSSTRATLSTFRLVNLWNRLFAFMSLWAR